MYELPMVLSTAVILHYQEGTLYTSLVSRRDPKSPGVTHWGLPTAPIRSPQTSLSSIDTFMGKLGIHGKDISYREQLYTTESTSAEQTQIRISYLYLMREMKWHKGDQIVQSFPVNKLPKIHPSDQAIIRYALDRLHAKALYSTITGFLLPKTFTLNDFQAVFETITGQSVDRRNFRKKIMQLDILTATNAAPTSSPEPATYRLAQPVFNLLEKPFVQKSAQKTQ